ncbi:MAG: TIR domain-containing protein [Ilumatobacteraceae bacterium]
MDNEALGAATGVGPVKIFMSYRRADDRHFIGRLHDRLCDAFGDEMVFRDIDSIPAGTNFRNVILRTLNEVDAVVAVIGPQWSRSPAGENAAADTDYVFLELAEALKQSKPTIPVLIENTEMPSPDALPSDLRALSDINAISVHGDPAFRRDSTRLIEAISTIVIEDRARTARAQREAQERAQLMEDERVERQRLAEQLRSEEREARARLAELEEAATRHQIEQERARLEAIEDRLRRTESAEQPTPLSIVEPTATIHSIPAAAAATISPTTRHAKVDLPWFQMLLVAGLILGVVALSLDRSVNISDSDFHFDELSSTTTVSAISWLLTSALAIPLFMGSRPVEQRAVLIGVVASSLLYDLLQASATVRYGTRYDERAWIVVKTLELACLVVAYRVLRKRSGGSPAAPPRFRAALLAIAVASGVLLVVATHKEFGDALTLIDQGTVPDRTPFALWLGLIAAPPIAATIAMAARGTYAGAVSLATLATLGVLSYIAEANFLDKTFDLDGSAWTLLALSQLLLAAVAWAATITGATSAPSPA